MHRDDKLIATRGSPEEYRGSSRSKLLGEEGLVDDGGYVEQGVAHPQQDALVAAARHFPTSAVAPQWNQAERRRYGIAWAELGKQDGPIDLGILRRSLHGSRKEAGLCHAPACATLRRRAQPESRFPPPIHSAHASADHRRVSASAPQHWRLEYSAAACNRQSVGTRILFFFLRERELLHAYLRHTRFRRLLHGVFARRQAGVGVAALRRSFFFF